MGKYDGQLIGYAMMVLLYAIMSYYDLEIIGQQLPSGNLT
jgi:hypothetical protein